MNHRRIFDAIAKDLTARYGMRIRYKDESLFMRAIGFVLVFAGDFMTQFTTTLGATVYFPTRAMIDQVAPPWGTLAHEGIHIRDDHAAPIRFRLGYAFPQIIGVLAVAALASFVSLWFLFALAFLVAAGPWPAPFRANSERRAYMMSMVCDVLRYGSDWVRSSSYQDWAVKTYTGWAYYRMSSSAAIVRQRVAADTEIAIALAEGRRYDSLYSPTVDLIQANR